VLGIISSLRIRATRKNSINIVHPTLPYPLFFDKKNEFIGMVVSK
jgi:hypothetical protein